MSRRLNPFIEEDPDKGQEETPLPDNFWEVPSSFIQDASIRKIYQVTYQRMLEENPDRDTFETLLIERAASLYSYLRQLESTTGYQNDLNYRQLMGLWQAMAQDMRKSRVGNVSEAKIRDEIAMEYIQIIDAAVRGLSPEIANTVRNRILTQLKG